MKKISKLLFIMGILLMICLVSTNSVKAETDDPVYFMNFDFTMSKMRKKGEMKVDINLVWDTKEEIVINKILYEIPGKKQDALNIDFHRTQNEDGTYHYSIKCPVENWQVGTLKLILNYVKTDNFENTYTKTFYIPGGKWLKEQVGWGISILFGLFTAISVGIGTFIIIENGKKGYVDLDIDE